MWNFLKRIDKKKSDRILIGTVFIIFISAFVVWKIKSNQLKNSHFNTTGTVTSVNLAKGGVWFDYTYEVNGVKFEGDDQYQINLKDAKYFIGHKFPLIYAKNSPENASILIIPNGFDRYGEKFPDSLEWVLKYPF